MGPRAIVRPGLLLLLHGQAVRHGLGASESHLLGHNLRLQCAARGVVEAYCRELQEEQYIHQPAEGISLEALRPSAAALDQLKRGRCGATRRFSNKSRATRQSASGEACEAMRQSVERYEDVGQPEESCGMCSFSQNCTCQPPSMLMVR